MLSPKNCAATVMHDGHGPFKCARDEGSLTRVQFRTGEVEWYCRAHAEAKACGPLDPAFVEVVCDCGYTTLVAQ